MIIKKLNLPGVLSITPKIYKDKRGYFFESYNQDNFKKYDLKTNYIQDNISYSKKGVIRGLHCQKFPHQQNKLINVIYGEIFDVIVDYRKNSKNYLKYISIKISDINKKQIFIPKGYLHGFQVISKYAIVNYKVDKPYSPKHEKTVLFNNRKINIQWPLKKKIISSKDLIENI